MTEQYIEIKIEELEKRIKALEQPCEDAEQIDYHDDFATASRKIHDYEERQKQNDKKCGSYNNTNTFKSCSDCKLIGTDSCYMVCGGSKSLYKPKQKSEPCDDAISRRFEKIVVEYPTICTYPEYQGKPYFSIQYEENGEHIVGFGTYKPEVLTRYLKEYFMPS